MMVSKSIPSRNHGIVTKNDYSMILLYFPTFFSTIEELQTTNIRKGGVPRRECEGGLYPPLQKMFEYLRNKCNALFKTLLGGPLMNGMVTVPVWAPAIQGGDTL